jgi:hypothetical protein
MKNFIFLVCLSPLTLFAQWVGTQTNSDVAINTSVTTGVKLHVNGITKFSNNGLRNLMIESDDQDSWISFHDPNHYIYSMGIDKSDGGKFKINTGGALGDVNHFVMDYSGNIGIGTTMPQAKLHVSTGAILASDPNYGDINVRLVGANVPAIRFTRYLGNTPATYHNAFVGQFHDATTGSYSFGIGTGSSADKEYTSRSLTIPVSGNVGIGTDNPSEKLNIYNNSSATRVLIGNPNSSTGGFTSLTVGTSADASGYGFIQAVKSAGSAWGDIILNQLGGNVGIGTTNPGSFKLAVNGKIWSQEVNVAMTNPGPDYVFEKDYNLLPLSELETYITQNKHLPEVPSAKEMEADGLNLKEMNLILLKKVEELTLHILQQEKRIQQLEEKQ